MNAMTVKMVFGLPLAVAGAGAAAGALTPGPPVDKAPAWFAPAAIGAGVALMAVQGPFRQGDAIVALSTLSAFAVAGSAAGGFVLAQQLRGA